MQSMSFVVSMFVFSLTGLEKASWCVLIGPFIVPKRFVDTSKFSYDEEKQLQYYKT